jgi:hypothetical protein
MSGRPGRIATFQKRQIHAFGSEGSVDEIVVADRSTAGGHENISRNVACPVDSCSDRLDRISDEAEIGHRRAFLARKRGERETIRTDDLPRSRLGAGRHQLVAGREECNLRPPMQCHQRVVHSGEKRKIARREPVTFGKEALPAAKVEALGADVAAFACRFKHLDAVGLAVRKFLHDYRIRTRWYHAAGENARRLAGADRSCKRPSGCDFTDHFQTDRGISNIRSTHRITVHGGHIGPRLGP